MNTPFAISDVGIMLYHLDTSSAPTWKELVGIKVAPATGGAPEQLDATELKSKYNQLAYDSAVQC